MYIMSVELETKVEQYLDQLRPALQSDGGDVEFVALKPDTGILELRFIGACSNCSISDVTLTGFIKENILQKFADIKDITIVP